MQRKIAKTVRGVQTIDGAGVHLVRVLGHDDVYDFDPFLMLDSFDSTDPEDYIKGFPMHPHRGIETITYLIEGDIEHQDSLGNKGSILSGQSQWMTAGSGIMHQEMPKPADRMLGFQLWLNLPKSEKMSPPAYYEITQEMIPAVQSGGALVHVIAGCYGDAVGARPKHIQATLLDVALASGALFTLDTKTDETAFLFTIIGDAVVQGRHIPEKTAVLFGEGDQIAVLAPESEASRIIFFSGKALHEPIAWGGPIVMNTKEELDLAFRQLRAGSFIISR
ncbi:MAG: pirin family protein [Clostridiaceae bacterium]|nr:pirin family protein [Clostridiaceae bacterium]